MDIERAIEHLLELHAKGEARMDKAEARMDKHDARMMKIDRRLDAMTKLMQTGMRALMEQNKRINMLIDGQVSTAESLRDLAESQKRTDLKFRAFLDSIRKGKNGRKNGDT